MTARAGGGVLLGEMSRALLILLLLLVTAGCGGGSSSSSASADLRITVWPQGKTGASTTYTLQERSTSPGASTTYTLTCPKGTGTLPEARAACSKLQRVGASAFAPVPPGTACTEIYGGPQTARVRGRLAGKAIGAVFSQSDGCQSARWSRLEFLFPTGS